MFWRHTLIGHGHILFNYLNPGLKFKIFQSDVQEKWSSYLMMSSSWIDDQDE